MILLSVAEIGHALAHILSTRYAGAPMDELLLSLAALPLPIVDGGTLVKWTLVARGRTETEADEIVRRVDWVMGIVGVLIGVGFIAMQMWIAGVILVGIGVVVMGIAAGKIR
jgi:hypothetical protein